MIPAVFDCMIYLQAANNRKGAAGACLALADDGHVRIFLSPGILRELDDVFHRSEIQSAFPKLTDELVHEFLTEARALAEIDDEAPAAFRLSRDPKDEPYLNLAIAKQPAFLVTWDNDLLDLMADGYFRNQFPHLRILNPPAFLAHARAEIAKTMGRE